MGEKDQRPVESGTRRHEAIELDSSDTGGEDWLEGSRTFDTPATAASTGKDFANWDGDLDVEMPVRKAAPEPPPPPPSTSEPASLRERILAWQADGLDREQIVTRLQAEGLTPQAARLEVRRASAPVTTTTPPAKSGTTRPGMPSRPVPISPDRPSQMPAYLFAAGAAVVGALMWGGLMYLTDREWGLLAWALGGLCGTAVVLAPGSIRGRHLQVAATASCVSGIALGKLVGLAFYITSFTTEINEAIEQARPGEILSDTEDPNENLLEINALVDQEYGVDEGHAAQLEQYRATMAVEEAERARNPLGYSDRELEEMRKEFETGTLEDYSTIEGMEDYPSYKQYSDFMEYAWAVDAYEKKQEAEFQAMLNEDGTVKPASLLWSVVGGMFGPLDLLFIFFAVTTAWRIPKAEDLPTEMAA